jgi:hypothetical protein
VVPAGPLHRGLDTEIFRQANAAEAVARPAPSTSFHSGTFPLSSARTTSP